MKRIVFAASALAWLLGWPCLAQENLIYNGSFEEVAKCPTDFLDFEYAKGWHILYGTPDLFADCVHKGWALAVPANYNGTRATFTGSNYAGLALSTCAGFRSKKVNYQATEAIYAQTVRPLRSGHRYRLTLTVSLADSAVFTVDSLYCSFSAEPPIAAKELKTVVGRWLKFRQSETYGGPLRVDCAGCWHTIEIEFVAQREYNYFSLGLPRSHYKAAAYYHDQAQSVRVVAASKWKELAAYYYMDDIRLVEV